MQIVKNMQNFLYDQDYFIDIYNNCLHVYYYLELISLSDKLIELKLDKFDLIIEGNNLCIVSLDKHEILIKGTLNNLRFVYAK